MKHPAIIQCSTLTSLSLSLFYREKLNVMPLIVLSWKSSIRSTKISRLKNGMYKLIRVRIVIVDFYYTTEVIFESWCLVQDWVDWLMILLDKVCNDLYFGSQFDLMCPFHAVHRF